jgi:hypothetical protein
VQASKRPPPSAASSSQSPKAKLSTSMNRGTSPVLVAGLSVSTTTMSSTSQLLSQPPSPSSMKMNRFCQPIATSRKPPISVAQEPMPISAAKVMNPESPASMMTTRPFNRCSLKLLGAPSRWATVEDLFPSLPPIGPSPGQRKQPSCGV